MSDTLTEDQDTIIDITVPDIPHKQRALGLLVDDGLSVPEAAKTLGYNTNYAYQVAHNLKKYGLSTKKKVQSASQVIQNCMDGKAWGDVKDVKDSTALAAAKMVYDVVQPATKQAVSVNVNISPIPLDPYRNSNT
jgi:hypothetical protein